MPVAASPQARRVLAPPAVIAFRCPYCEIQTVVLRKELRCGVFICGVHARTGAQVSQHDEAGARALLEAGLIIGCAGQYEWDGSQMKKTTGK